MVKWDGGRPRPAREYPDEDREIRFFFDYGCEWPLWEDNTAEHMMAPEDYGLSPELVALLRRCVALWDPVAPDAATNQAEFERSCAKAVEMLRTEVYPIKVVQE